jgi:hypothetical protein
MGLPFARQGQLLQVFVILLLAVCCGCACDMVEAHAVTLIAPSGQGAVVGMLDTARALARIALDLTENRQGPSALFFVCQWQVFEGFVVDKRFVAVKVAVENVVVVFGQVGIVIIVNGVTVILVDAVEGLIDNEFVHGQFLSEKGGCWLLDARFAELTQERAGGATAGKVGFFAGLLGTALCLLFGLLC